MLFFNKKEQGTFNLFPFLLFYRKLDVSSQIVTIFTAPLIKPVQHIGLKILSKERVSVIINTII